jgi:hypothetical protein
MEYIASKVHEGDDGDVTASSCMRDRLNPSLGQRETRNLLLDARYRSLMKRLVLLHERSEVSPRQIVWLVRFRCSIAGI